MLKQILITKTNNEFIRNDASRRMTAKGKI
jgi:hypothetical protein